MDRLTKIHVKASVFWIAFNWLSQWLFNAPLVTAWKRIMAYYKCLILYCYYRKELKHRHRRRTASQYSPTIMELNKVYPVGFVVCTSQTNFLCLRRRRVRRRHYVFGSSVRASVRVSGVRPVRTISYKFYETLVDDVVEATDELIRFWKSRIKVRVATRSDVTKFGTHIAWAAWNITIKLEYVTYIHTYIHKNL